jgi:prophage DNA circulation protein
MEERLKVLEDNLSTVSVELVALKSLIASSFMKVEANFSVVSRNLAVIEKNIKTLNFKVDNLDNIEKSIKTLNFKLDNLDTSTSSGLSEVGTKIESLTEEIIKIGAVTKYDEMFKNQQGLSKN